MPPPLLARTAAHGLGTGLGSHPLRPSDLAGFSPGCLVVEVPGDEVVLRHGGHIQTAHRGGGTPARLFDLPQLHHQQILHDGGVS
jgi:hypothetical protein